MTLTTIFELHIHTIGTQGTKPQQGSSSQNPVLHDFVDNLTSLDGGALKIDETKQIVTDFSKYMTFADGSHARWFSLTEVDKLKSYLTKLTRTAIGPDGVTTKIDRLVDQNTEDNVPSTDSVDVVRGVTTC